MNNFSMILHDYKTYSPSGDLIGIYILMAVFIISILVLLYCFSYQKHMKALNQPVKELADSAIWLFGSGLAISGILLLSISVMSFSKIDLDEQMYVRKWQERNLVNILDFNEVNPTYKAKILELDGKIKLMEKKGYLSGANYRYIKNENKKIKELEAKLAILDAEKRISERNEEIRLKFQ
ncbi:hypothetical protein AMD27_17430 (plasmid) [Acinetobacter sp. TGL-Y2]|uniref:hypothetical protein n=1 Tax=Acinetobacter sp. TGL-Y2 TaxID=1407071 RepID=UPI0007A66CD8|nr:hypothetical protein [Acinetobacter sp. TGL-Y2]AMW80698.1 hypothetical protein AMD27_17430 [Acinetobacter sp. TGL-Y2]